MLSIINIKNTVHMAVLEEHEYVEYVALVCSWKQWVVSN